MKLVNKRKNVAWVKDVFCPMSETFIYEPLRYFRKWRPIVLAQKLENQEVFPYDYVVKFNRERYKTLFYKVKNKLFYHATPLDNFLREHCKKYRARLIHAHFGPRGVNSLTTAKKLGLPLVTTFYGYDLSVLPQQELWGNAYRNLFKEGHFFIVEGPHMKEQLIRIGCPADKLRINHIGVDIGEYTFRPRSVKKSEKVRILMAGRFVEKKGMEYGIRAFAQVIKNYENLELRILGDGPLKDKLAKLVSELRLDKHVIIVGFISHDDFRKELYDAHIGLVPSITASDGDTEGGAPKILLEMQASGLPIVTTKHADIPNVVLEGKSARIVPERDVYGLALTLEQMLESPELWGEMGWQGSEYMSRDFSLEKTVAELERIYDSAIAD